MVGRTHKHARERLNFEGEVSVADRLAACKTFLQAESAMIRMHHDAGEPGPRDRPGPRRDHGRHAGVLFDYALESYRRAHGSPARPGLR